MSKKIGNFHHGNLSDALVEAATRLITERKATTFSLREVALSLGVSHAAAYRHFKSKSDLLAVIAQTGFAQLRQALEASHVSSAGVLDVKHTLRAMGDAYIDFAINNAGAYRTLFHHDICDAEQYPQLSEVSLSSLQVLIDALATGQKTGVVANSPHATDLATSIWAALHGYSTLLLDRQISETNDEYIPPAHRDIFLDFIYARLFVN